MNPELTASAIDGYLQRQRAMGAHPSETMAILFTLAEWAMILKALRPSEAEGEWLSVSTNPPDYDVQVLVRGWGEKRKHYIFSLAKRVQLLTGSKWKGDDPSDCSDQLWFAPVDWMRLPSSDIEERK